MSEKVLEQYLVFKVSLEFLMSSGGTVLSALVCGLRGLEICLVSQYLEPICCQTLNVRRVFYDGVRLVG